MELEELLRNDRTCGRPTKANLPCKNRLTTFEIACSKHVGADETKLSKLLFQTFWAGHSKGHESGIKWGRFEVESEARKKQAEETRAANFRLTDRLGRQIVAIGNYSYVWNGTEPLAIGDKVRLPGNWLFEHQREATVTGLGTAYTGGLAEVIGKVAS